ncbi:hypothetical protein JX265_010334 [Neoarthrinium moseri]|uniref:Uncharacterized protein n=1 Tax=Neoarthrinium moseri TaxID=1658444 RepID=A0A9P9WE60_9PEZI|nr:hypothetical protein JX265_010334 [Neoarthrinium moseri]
MRYMARAWLCHAPTAVSASLSHVPPSRRCLAFVARPTLLAPSSPSARSGWASLLHTTRPTSTAHRNPDTVSPSPQASKIAATKTGTAPGSESEPESGSKKTSTNGSRQPFFWQEWLAAHNPGEHGRKEIKKIKRQFVFFRRRSALDLLRLDIMRQSLGGRRATAIRCAVGAEEGWNFGWHFHPDEIASEVIHGFSQACDYVRLTDDEFAALDKKYRTPWEQKVVAAASLKGEGVEKVSQAKRRRLRTRRHVRRAKMDVFRAVYGPRWLAKYDAYCAEQQRDTNPGDTSPSPPPVTGRGPVKVGRVCQSERSGPTASDETREA